MELYMKQRVFSWGDRFEIYGTSGEVRYTVEGEVFSLGKRLHILDPYGRELAFIHEKLMAFLPKYYISRDGADIAEVVREFTFFRSRYTVNGPGWTVSGDFFDHEYEISDGQRQVAAVSKEWLSWGDAYAIHIASGVDPVLALAVVLVIDACIEDANNN